MASRKTITFAIMHMSVAFAVVYLMTGSLALGGAVAMIEPAVNTIAYFFHEKVWERHRLGAAPKKSSAPPTHCPFHGRAPRPTNPVARCLQCQWRARTFPDRTAA